jgi:hypothetical protein
MTPIGTDLRMTAAYRWSGLSGCDRCHGWRGAGLCSAAVCTVRLEILTPDEILAEHRPIRDHSIVARAVAAAR